MNIEKAGEHLLQVLEKGCKANIETKCLGGGIRINKIEAYLMRLVYQYKYSKLK